MNIKRQTISTFILAVTLLISGCGPGQFLGPTTTPTATDTPTPTATPIPVTGKYTGILISTDTGKPFTNVPTLKLVFGVEGGVTKETVISYTNTNDANGKFEFELTFPKGIDKVHAFVLTSGCGSPGVQKGIVDALNMQNLGTLTIGQTVDVGTIKMSCYSH